MRKKGLSGIRRIRVPRPQVGKNGLAWLMELNKLRAQDI